MTGLSRCSPVALGLGLACLSGAPLADQVDVSEELARLARTHGFEVTGLAHTEGGRGRAEGENLQRRLRWLLADYDHVIVAMPSGTIDRVIILGEKAAWTPPPAPQPNADVEEAEESELGHIVLQTTRNGSQRAVTVTLEGVGERRIEQSVLIDTGADYVVLPRSLLSLLAIEPVRLREQEVQTANGKVTAQLGRLPALWLGAARLTGIEAAFIEDEKLGGNALLGMNVLGRYRLTIDDEHNELRLVER